MMSHDSRPFATGRLATLLLAVGLAASAGSVGAQEPRTPPSATEGVDFVVYDRTGRSSSLQAILDQVRSADVVLVGEEHGDLPGHAFESLLFDGALAQIGVTAREAGRPIVLSLEMFERDVQYVVDEYLADLISEAHFMRSARPWEDYDLRYRPLVEAAKEAGAPVVAANAPRRYVNRVTTDGPASLGELSDQAKTYLPPLPYPGPSALYRAQWDALMSEAMAAMQAPTPEPDDPPEPDQPEEEEPSGPDHAMPDNAIYAQALWDASMGHAITESLVRHLGALVIHYAGSFHVERDTGIPERIRDYRPGTRVTTVVMTKVADIEAWSDEDHADLGDFVVLTRAPAETTDPALR